VKWYRDSARRGDRVSPLPGRRGEGEVDEGVLECSLDELREFLEADLADVHFDLEFKQSLRQKLWELLQTRNLSRGRTPGRH